MNKLKNIDYIKTTMMLFVVLYHSMLFFNGTWFEFTKPLLNAPYLGKIASWMNTFHIQTFCMASGYLFYYLKVEKNKYNIPKKDIKNRAKRLLVPFVFTLMLWVIPISTYFFRFSILDIFKNYLLAGNPNQLWFLIMLFWVFCFFELFADKININIKNLVVIYLVCTILNYVLSYVNFDYFQIRKSIQYLLYFYLGIYIYIYKDKISLKQIFMIMLFSVVLYITYIILNDMNIKVFHYVSLFILPIVSVFEVCIIYYFFSVFTKKYSINNKLYNLLSQNSFGVYLFHQQIIYFTIILFNGIVHPIVQVLLSFIISLGISLLMSFILKKNKITKFMFGL